MLFRVRRRWNEQKTMQSAAAVLFALPRTVPVLAAVPERLTTVVEQPVEAQSWEVDAVSGATLTAEGQISVGGIEHCARACGCRYWRRRCSSSCWAAGWVSADLSEPKKEAAARYLCSSLLLAGMICHFYREGFCSNRSVMLCRLMPRVERLCSIALVAGGRMPSAPRRMSAELKLSTKR